MHGKEGGGRLRNRQVGGVRIQDNLKTLFLQHFLRKEPVVSPMTLPLLPLLLLEP